MLTRPVVAAGPGTARPGVERPIPVPAGGMVVADPGGVAEVPARPAVDGLLAGVEAAGGRAEGGVAAGRVPEPRPGGGMSRTLPVLGNSYGIVLATVG